MSEHGGLLGFLSEANEIRQEMGVSADEAFEIQRERAAERWREYERQQAEAGEGARLDRVALRVAEKLGCTPESAREQLDAWDRVHEEQFCKGNVIPFRSRN